MKSNFGYISCTREPAQPMDYMQYAPFTMHTLLRGYDECSEKENRVIASAFLINYQ